MLIRQLILAMLGMAFAYFVRRAITQSGTRQPGGASTGKGALPVDGKMVRDRVCNTYLPEHSALTARQDGSTHYFCSEACRQSFLTGRAAS